MRFPSRKTRKQKKINLKKKKKKKIDALKLFLDCGNDKRPKVSGKSLPRNREKRKKRKERGVLEEVRGDRERRLGMVYT